MKPEEQVAKVYLDRLQIGPISFEPDGNIPPDFSLGGSTGIEVRRLNQNYFGGAEPRGLEELAIPLWEIFVRALSSFDSKFDGKSYWVFVEFERPSMQKGREVDTSIQESLQDFLRNGGHTPARLVINHNLTLVVYPATPVPQRVFRPGGRMDCDSGGFLVPMYVDNISFCIAEKSQKIAPYEDRYLTWWLLLVDFMGWGIDGREAAEVRSGIDSLERFDRVIVIGSKHGEMRLDLRDVGE